MRRGETVAMREWPAGGAMRDWRRNGLIARLAALESHVGTRARGNACEPWRSKRIPLAPFALGLSASLVCGAAAAWFLALTPALGAAEQPRAALGGPPSFSQPQGRLEMEIVRSDQPSAFPLRVSGLEDVANARVVLRNLPEALWFSRGERRDEHTWDLAGADLEELCVTLRAGTPQAFALDIEVVAGDAAPLARSIAAVRVLGGPSAARSTVSSSSSSSPSPSPSPSPSAPLRPQIAAASPTGGGASAVKADVAPFQRPVVTFAPQVAAREVRPRAA